MRLFVAIKIDEAVRGALAAVQTRLAASGAPVRWIEPENFHLTVSFLGDQPDARVSQIEAICADLAVRTTPFRLQVRGASAFPRRGPLKTLWVGLSHGANEWKALVKRGEAPFAALGVPREGGLVPHVTLGRLRSEHGQDDLQQALAAESNVDCGVQSACGIVLVQSFLDPCGAVYKNLAAWSFNESAAT